MVQHYQDLNSNSQLYGTTLSGPEQWCHNDQQLPIGGCMVQHYQDLNSNRQLYGTTLSGPECQWWHNEGGGGSNLLKKPLCKLEWPL